MMAVSEEEGVTLEVLRKKMADFARERDWEKFHSPRNLLLAMDNNGVERRGPKGLPDWKEEEKLHLGEELSDVLLYLVRLSDICGVDLGKAALRKLELNAKKYPVNLCKGSSKKHTQINSNQTQSPTRMVVFERTATVVAAASAKAALIGLDLLCFSVPMTS
ncbi:dCTP pyrophosphatase 1 [Vitis vinifera]|uniref:dCTP pyrophosphatase 1 n=1 Tax=Vitis vinifera TaxID=29760 RepID=A0A438D6G1_VITVI|nr:dCTP pyrophosphatase 1 [Vitis vinifera]